MDMIHQTRFGISGRRCIFLNHPLVKASIKGCISIPYTRIKLIEKQPSYPNNNSFAV